MHSQSTVHADDAALASSLARLWPHRWHESNCLLNTLCHFGLHRWMQLDLSTLVPEKEVRFCFWCDKVKIDGAVYGDHSQPEPSFAAAWSSIENRASWNLSLQRP